MALVAQRLLTLVAQPHLLAAVALVVAGCSGGNDGPPSDGAPDQPGDRPRGCLANTVCSGNTVHVCENGVPGIAIELCAPGDLCSNGRCTSQACADAERQQAMVGCLFYTLDLDNVSMDDPQRLLVLLANPGGIGANVALQQRDPGRRWRTIQTIGIPPGGADTFELSDRHLEGGGHGRALAWRLVSDAPITATHLQSDDSNDQSQSSGGTVLLPLHALGTQYMALTYPQINTPKIAAVPGSRGGAGQLAVVATEDGTRVTFKLPSLDLPFDVTLDDGDLYQVYSSLEGQDLSGSEISANRPIAVFSGNIFTSYGRAKEDPSAGVLNTPDMAHEQMIPLRNWARRYVAAWFPPQNTACDRFLGESGVALWRILASQDDTRVSFFARPQVIGLPAGGLSLMRGEVAELVVAGDFLVSADKPVMVGQGMDCEATLSSAIPVDPLLEDSLIALPPNFDHELTLIRKRGAVVTLDGLPVDGVFAPVAEDFEAVRVRFLPCNGPAGACLHRVRGSFGLTLRGMDVFCSYAITVPSWVRCVDAEPGCVN
jgi:hypothetical protein